MVNEKQYISSMEKIYDKTVRSNRLTIKECKELEQDLQTALQYSNIYLRDRENFLYHQQHIQEYYSINKSRINNSILSQQAQIQICKDRIAELEKQLA